MTTEDANEPNEAMEVDAAQTANHDSDEEDGWFVADDIRIPPPPKVFGEIDTKGPRLMMVKIVAKNFKSYAGEVEIGPFHKCFSSIVGPNGNGKSNAVDSILFVFGYRANKIRSKKISELIHNSNEHPNCNSCSVYIHFQEIIDKGESDYEVVPNSEFVISRTAFKDSTAFYELNGRRVQFKEIAKLLRSHHVDLDHNRFLILQGEVEQIALMKPKGQMEGDTGMLEFLEDIIGTTRYKEPLTKLLDRVDILTEQREEKLRRLKVAEKAKSELEAPMQEAVQYLRVENSIIKWQHKYYQCKKYEATQQLIQEEENKREFETDYNKLIDEMKELQDAKAEKTQELKEKSKKWDKIQEEKNKFTAKFDDLRKKDEAFHAESVETNKRRKENINTVKNEKSKLEELLRVPAKNEKDIQECENLVVKHTADIKKEEAVLETLMSGLNEKIEPLSKKRRDFEKELLTLKKDVDSAKSAYELAKSKLQLYTSEEQTEKNKLDELKEILKANFEKLKERKEQLALLEKKIPATEKNLNEAQGEMQEVMNKEAQAQQKLKNVRMKFDEQKSMMQASRSRNRCLDALMKEKRDGRIPGILGRLGDLGAIDAKYDVAVSTACGPLDNIIVDTVNTAQECINFLRVNDIGRATFIALDKQQHLMQKCKEKIRTPENVHRLFDLIKVENESVLPAFYYGLQNTLVAEDLDQATRIAYGAQRFRVVTLKGELIELSGTMSGGGRTVYRGRMGQRVVRSEPTAVDIEKLQKSLDEIFAECNDLHAQQIPIRNQIQALSSGLNDMKIEKGRYSIEVKTLSEQEPHLKKQLKEQEKRVENSTCDPAKVNELKKNVKKAEDHLKKVETDSKEIENQVETINQEIEEISGGKVKEQQKKISNLKKSLDKAKAEICRLQVAIKTAERNTKKTEQKIESLEADIKNCEQKIRDIQKEKLGFEEQAKEVMEHLEKLNEQLEERDELTASLKKELEKLQSRESKMKAVKIDLDQKMNQMKKIVNELEKRIPDLTRACQNLKLQDIPNENNEGFVEMSEEQLQNEDIKHVAAQLQKAKERLPKDIPNMQIIEQFREQNEIYLKRSEKLQKITEERNKMRDTYNLAVRKRNQEFNAGFNLISSKLKEMYRMITLGGDAELELVDSLDPFSEGIVFSVRPPKKSWKYIQNLSGGEKTLSSLALVFALHHYKPTPLYFMDEIDAALDFKNVSIVASYIKERTKNAQFIVVSHRSDMFELADYLVGIYKIYNCSNCAVIAVKKFNSKVGIVEPQPQANNNNKQPSLSQPNHHVSRTLTTENRGDSLQPQRLNFPLTCPENINSVRNEGSNENDNQSNDELGLGELSLPPTPQKSLLNPAKRRKIDENMPKSSEKVSPPTKATKSQKNTANTLDKVSKKLENIAKTNVEKNTEEDVAEPTVQETPRRSLRTPRKSKNPDVDDNITAKKRRR